jgi:DNA-binding Xre family transcriptional regulator
MTINIVLAELIASRGLNQKELAAMTGIRASAISYLCRGYVDRICIDHIERIATALEITDINEIIRLEATA